MKQYRHRRSANPSNPFPLLEPGELSINTANRQLAGGDAAVGNVGIPLPLIAVRYFDSRAAYVTDDLVVQAGSIYKANAAVPPGAFNASNWTQLGSGGTGGSAATVTFAPTGNVAATDVQAAIAELDTEKVAKAGDTMTGSLVLPVGSGAATSLNFGGVNTGFYGIGTTNLAAAISGVNRLSLSGTTMVLAVALRLPVSALAAAPLRLPPGVAPTTLGDGDMWTTTAGMFARINGATVGPYGVGDVSKSYVDSQDALKASKATVSTSPPSGGVDGDVWYQVAP